MNVSLVMPNISLDQYYQPSNQSCIKYSTSKYQYQYKY